MSSALATRLAHILDSITPQLHTEAPEFIGRDFVRAQVDHFRSEHNRILVLVGPPGIGKTALTAALVREHVNTDNPYLVHFCSSRDGHDPIVFCRSLADQLAALLGADFPLPDVEGKKVELNVDIHVDRASAAQVTGLEIKSLTIGGIPPATAFRTLVREPLRAFDTRHGETRRNRPLVIMIDGLDRAWEWDRTQGGNIVDLLADVQDLPEWVSLICTARPGPAVQLLRTQAGVQVFSINPDSAENRADIGAFFQSVFIDRLDAAQRARFVDLLDDTGIAGMPATPSESDAADPQPATGDDAGAALVATFKEQIVQASEGNFLFMRRYIDAWIEAMYPDAAPSSAQALLRFNDGVLSLVGALDASYAAIYERIRDPRNDSVLGMLSVLFEPASVALLARLTRQPVDPIVHALERLSPVISHSQSGKVDTYELFHSGFAEYIRKHITPGGRELDLRAAQALEQIDDNDPLMRDYSAHYRWRHLVRGLELVAAPVVVPLPTRTAEGAPPEGSQALRWQDGVAKIQGMARDTVTQARLLRLVAARALDPQQSNVDGSWAAGLNYLKAAEKTIRQSRAMQHLRRRTNYFIAPTTIPPEVVELEHTLVALGDAYATIARRMDGGAEEIDRWKGLASYFYMAWDGLVRLPLTIYLLLVLALQGVSEIHIRGALRNLGRSQDWTVARLYVLSVSAYRRARRMAYQRGADDSIDDIVERLGRVYREMGAFDAAIASYEMLLARPEAISSPWRQSVWLLALGRVLLASGKVDRAVEVLTSALPVFTVQGAYALQARALTALAWAYYEQADSAEAGHDDIAAQAADDRALAHCREAIAAWQAIDKLQGDETASVDPALRISRITHLIWHIGSNPRSTDAQVQRSRALLDTISERHYPQRFEHPVLRWFRVLTTALLPAVVMFGLLIAIQIPSNFLVSTQVELSLLPPFVDLNTFPNSLIDADRSAVGNLNPEDLTRLVTGAGWRQFQTTAPILTLPKLDLGALTSVILLVLGAYFLFYTIVGLAAVIFFSPTQYQNRRPGRLILSHDQLSWHGPAGQGSFGDALRWMADDLRSLARQLWERVLVLSGRHKVVPERRDTGQVPKIMLRDIGGIITTDWTAFGNLLGDYSSTLVHPREDNDQLIRIPGALAGYDELCDELEQRVEQKRRRFNVEIVRSLPGICFLVTLAYALAMIILLPLASGLVSTPLPLIGYSLSSLYVLAAPGLLFPLLWWFCVQPIGARIASRERMSRSLAALVVLSVIVSVGALGRWYNLNLLSLDPDLFTPVLAVGLLAILVVYGPQRPIYRILSLSAILRMAMTLVALAGLSVLAWEIGVSLLWYDAQVRGNQQILNALSDPECADQECAAFDDAIYQYTRMICLRPGDSDGFTFRGFTLLAQHRYDWAAVDFQDALRAGKGEASAYSDHCLGPVPQTLTTFQAAGLHANIGAAHMLLARQVALDSIVRFGEMEGLYEAALNHFMTGINLFEAAGSPDYPRSTTNCSDLAHNWLGGEIGQALEPATFGMRRLSPEQLPITLRLADTCYSRGFSRARAIVLVPDELSEHNGFPLLARTVSQKTADQSELLSRNAWYDLAGAVQLYATVVANSNSEDERRLARRGMAATWLVMGQFNAAPAGAADTHSYLLQALRTYQALEYEGVRDAGILSSQAWSIILLESWNSANQPLVAATELDPRNPAYLALQGLSAWLESTKYPPAAKEAPSADYTAALKQAVNYYTQSIALIDQDHSRAYATRSFMFYLLRNSPYAGDEYIDDDYGTWMRWAITDVDQALIEAEHAGLPPEQQAGYRYWRARLSMSLAITWQRKVRGLHSWDELAPLYNRALKDLTDAVAVDPNRNRRHPYETLWIPWARYMLNNATHMQLATQAARNGEFILARREMELIRPRVSAIAKQADPFSDPLPEYSFMHGLISLGLNQPEDFSNFLVDGKGFAEESYAHAITETENQRRVPLDVRRAVYAEALADLDALLQRPTLSNATRETAQRIRAKLLARMGR